MSNPTGSNPTQRSGPERRLGPHELPPSPWVRRFAPLVPEGGAVLDLACGAGRHGRLFLDRGHPVTFVDVATEGVADLVGRAEIVTADLEGGPWPLPGRRFAAVVVTNYLHRPLFPTLREALAEGGILIHETFAKGNETFGRPRNPDHLLDPGELLRAADGLQVIAFEQGITGRPAVVQRLCAAKTGAPLILPE